MSVRPTARCFACKANKNLTNAKLHHDEKQLRASGNCESCGRKLSTFISSGQKGQGVLNWFINNLPGEAHLTDPINGKYHFAGPGTKYVERISGKMGLDDRGRPNSEPINALDALAKEHDKAYNEYQDVAHRNVADKIMMDGTDKIIEDPKTDFFQRQEARLVKKIFAQKIKSGAGTSK